MSFSKKELTITIKNICANEGFSKVGIAKAEKLTEEEPYFKKWLTKEMNGDMKWMNNSFEKRLDPRRIDENIRSVISLAYLYDTPVLHSNDTNIPKISRYAWGKRDYHKVLKKKLKSVCRSIEELSPEIKTWSYVDDGPVMDKAWAVRSGIGWMGKHTNVINPDIGSFFFLCDIFLNFELEYDEPIGDLCKNCTLCINACPTGAIYDEYKLDANLCISYQTIENRNGIPDDISLEGWIFGCDICQDVCPYNGRKVFTNDDNFYPRIDVINKTFDEQLGMTEEEFNTIFEGTPIRRTKYSGWMRNLKKAKQKVLH
ncbi:MAG: tRNA epoxyqueuosine(34) reductase QueG [Ignavibacteriae bacterium]|nr:tRNA epoxyqueuosine(34) reductase QueG [Ignavibacteriota bacterium]